MKLQNKKTGVIATVNGFGCTEGEIQMTYTIDNDETKLYLYCTPSLTTFNEEWEDCEEPKEYWYLMGKGEIRCIEDEDTDFDNSHKEIGNYFETKEEAEKVVEKLKVWKRLKDNGISFEVKVIDRKWYLKPDAEPKERTFDEAESLMDDVMYVFGVEE